MFTSKAPRAQQAKLLRDQKCDPPHPEMPTSALPGSDDKVSVLIERANSGKGLWHHSDRKWADAVADAPKASTPEQFVFSLTLADLFESVGR